MPGTEPAALHGSFSAHNHSSTMTATLQMKKRRCKVGQALAEVHKVRGRTESMDSRALDPPS